MFEGQVMLGACVSFTVIVKVHDAVLPTPSVAVHVTVVVPFANVAPEAGKQFTVGLEQLSVAVGVVYVTTAEHKFGSFDFVILAGHVIAGGVVSGVTLTVSVAVAAAL